MKPRHFGIKRGFWLLRAFGALLFAVVCAYALRASAGTGAWWLGIIGLVFFGTGAIVGLVQGLRSGARLTIDDDGIHDRSLGIGVIAWSDITRAEPYGVAGNPFIGIDVRDRSKYLARASGFKRALGRLNAGAGAHFSVNLVGVDADPGEVAELIVSRVHGGQAGAG